MPIHVPGIRTRRGKVLNRKRNIVAILSLTAMVDMFTVLTVFLLQNYNQTGQVINIPKEIQLPKATKVKELKPAHVVTVTSDNVLIDDQKVAPFLQVKEQKDWLIPPLQVAFAQAVKADQEKKKASLKKKLQEAVRGAKNPGGVDDEDSTTKVTLQADKAVDFLTIKKVMYTLTEAGATEINFAVIQKEKIKTVQ